METIFALSSGAPPAGIAVIRVSGPAAGSAIESLAGSLPAPRQATRRLLRDLEGGVLDDGLVLWFPGPRSVTGEDVAEFHIHGGRAVVVAIERALGRLPALRQAEPGEFTRRGFANGRIDLAEAEGLADLLAAETELQRRAAMTVAGGGLSRQIERWRQTVLMLSAEVEAVLDFDEEDLVSGLSETFMTALGEIQSEIAGSLAAPDAEILREGFRIAIAGPPNAGKSTLFNALVASEAAIVTALAGTTRDVLSRSVALAGVPFTFVDMAGLRADGAGPVEAIGIRRAVDEIERADLVLWLGAEGEGPPGAWDIEAQCDRVERPTGIAPKAAPQFRISAKTGAGMESLRDGLLAHARGALPKPGEVALNRRQRSLLAAVERPLADARSLADPLLVAESLRQCRSVFDALLGRTSTEDMLDSLFARFCIGK